MALRFRVSLGCLPSLRYSVGPFLSGLICAKPVLRWPVLHQASSSAKHLFSHLALQHFTETPLRLVRGDNDVLLALSNDEAAHLMDACALVVLAAESVPHASLDPELSTLLQELFVSLQPAVANRRQPDPIDPDSTRQ